jgi:hypothetical protein
MLMTYLSLAVLMALSLSYFLSNVYLINTVQYFSIDYPSFLLLFTAYPHCAFPPRLLPLPHLYFLPILCFLFPLFLFSSFFFLFALFLALIYIRSSSTLFFTPIFYFYIPWLRFPVLLCFLPRICISCLSTLSLSPRCMFPVYPLGTILIYNCYLSFLFLSSHLHILLVYTLIFFSLSILSDLLYWLPVHLLRYF